MVVRYKIPGDPISITYGCDMEYGIKIFLAVYDSRLECDERTSKDVRKVLEQIGDRDCEGSYFNVRTGPIGYGQRVSKKAMEAFMRRFGVPEKHIAELMESEPCFVCNESTTKTCGKCKAVTGQLNAICDLLKRILFFVSCFARPSIAAQRAKRPTGSVTRYSAARSRFQTRRLASALCRPCCCRQIRRSRCLCECRWWE